METHRGADDSSKKVSISPNSQFLMSEHGRYSGSSLTSIGERLKICRQRYFTSKVPRNKSKQETRSTLSKLSERIPRMGINRVSSAILKVAQCIGIGILLLFWPFTIPLVLFLSFITIGNAFETQPIILHTSRWTHNCAI